MMPQTTMITAIHLRAPKRGQRQIARHLEKEVSREEDSRTQAVNFIAESQLPLHLESGESHVDSIQVGNDVKEKQEGQQSPGQLGDDLGAEINSSERMA